MSDDEGGRQRLGGASLGVGAVLVGSVVTLMGAGIGSRDAFDAQGRPAGVAPAEPPLALAGAALLGDAGPPEG